MREDRSGERPRLLVVASTFPAAPGDGTPAFVADLARRQATAFDTLVLVPRVPGAEREETCEGYRILRFPYFPARWEDVAVGAIMENVRARPSRALQALSLVAAEAVAIRRTVRRFRPDVVHLHWLVPQGIAALLGGLGGRPFVVTTHGGDLYGLSQPWWTAVKRAVVARCAAATAVNADLAERLRALGDPPGGVHVLPMGADAELIHASDPGRPPAPGRIMVVGRLVEKKGVDVLLRALALVPAGETWSLDVVGDGPARRSLEALAAPMGTRVRFHGLLPQRRIAAMWYECEVGVFPSVPARSGDQDGLPVALLEAMTAGRAVVASRLPGIDQVVVEGDSGVLVPPGRPDALAEAIAGLLGDPSRRSRLAHGARLRAAEYSADSVADRYIDLLRAQLTPALAPAAPARPRRDVISPRSLAPYVQRRGANLLLGTRGWTDAKVAEIASDFRGSVLEIGSGRQDLGFEAYSLRRLFAGAAEFVQSDVNPEFGHETVDVTAMDFDERFDLILCLYVLEHVYDVTSAVRNLHRALRPGGRLVLAVPHLYPYHDEPIDFWRFTEHSLRQLLADFADVDIDHRGPRRLPKGLYVVATKAA